MKNSGELKVEGLVLPADLVTPSLELTVELSEEKGGHAFCRDTVITVVHVRLVLVPLLSYSASSPLVCHILLPPSPSTV